MSKPIVVTGAAGFIGRNVVAALNQRGVENLLLVDWLGKNDKWRNLLGLRFDDLVEPQQFLDRVGSLDADAIIHLGACSSTTESDADFLLKNNYNYTRALCEASAARGIRFIYASSAATYGDGSLGYSDDDRVIPTLRPLNMYGYSKHLFDLWALRHGLLDRVVGLKYFNVFGPGEDYKGEMRSGVNKAWQQLRETGEITLFKSDRPDIPDGEQRRDFIYVKDAVAVTLHFLDHRGKSGLFNCGTGVARTWKDLARAVFKAAQRPEKIRYVEMPPNLRGKYQYFTQADIAKLRSAGYAAPFTSLEAAVADYIGAERGAGSA